MKGSFRWAAMCLLLVASAAAQVVPQRRSVLAHKPEKPPAKFFPYPIYERTLANGLHILIVPTPEFKDMVSYTTPVFAGSRNETEKGKTGLAHLFEHIMFRHEYDGVAGGYQAMMNRLGSYNNAFTTYDFTFYHPFTFAQNLVGPVATPQGPAPGVIELEASRFKGLKMDQKTFQVEAGAVLGEYRRIYSFPAQKMIEQMSPIAFPHHPYGHTVIGYLDDVEKMPQAWDAAWQFFHNYYTPNDVALIVVGDVNPHKLFPAIEKAYADWKPVPTPKIPVPTEPKEHRPVHVDWDAEVAPRLSGGVSHAGVQSRHTRVGGRAGAGRTADLTLGAALPEVALPEAIGDLVRDLCVAPLHRPALDAAGRRAQPGALPEGRHEVRG